MVRNYLGQTKWSPGVIKARRGRLHYDVEVNERLVKRHVDQLRSRGAGLVCMWEDREWCDTYDLCDLVSIGDVLPDGVRGDDNPEVVENSRTDFVPRRTGRARKFPNRLNL